MVLMNAGKMARHQSSITALPTCGGSAKKAGIAPQVGWFLTSNVHLTGAPQSVPRKCVIWPITQTQRYGYRAVNGGTGQ